MNRLAGEQIAAGKQEPFETFKPWLTGDKQGVAPADAAQRLGMTEGAFKVALHRLRKRFRELVREEIAATVDDPTQAREELRYLLEVLSKAAASA